MADTVGNVISKMVRSNSNIEVFEPNGFRLPPRNVSPDLIFNHKVDTETFRLLHKSYPDWSREEIERLYYFRLYHRLEDSEYTYAYCGVCQHEHVRQLEDGRLEFIQPKAEVDFRTYVNMCYTNVCVACKDCLSKLNEADKRRRFSSMNIPKDYVKAYLSNWKQNEEYQKSLYYAAEIFVHNIDRQYGMFLSGSAGTGKTRLAVTMLNECALKYPNMSMYYIDFPSLATSSEIGKAERARYEEYDLLVIDDVTKTGIGYQFGSNVYPIIHTRIAQRRPTVITTNMPIRGWLNHKNEYVQRLGDRFRYFITRDTTGQKSLRGVLNGKA